MEKFHYGMENVKSLNLAHTQEHMANNVLPGTTATLFLRYVHGPSHREVHLETES